MKSVKILSLAFGVILLVSAASFAQTSMTTTYANIPTTVNAQTGLVGELDFVPLVTTGTIPAGESITITYGAPISSLSDIQVFVLGCNGNAALTISPTTGIGTAAACVGSSTTVTANVNYKPSGSVVLSFGGTGTLSTTISTQFVRITGIRVDVNSLNAAVGAVINASVTNSTGLGSITNSFVPVATVTEPISISGPTSLTGVPVTGGTASGNLVISELYSDAFETKGATSPTQILVTLAPPTGFTFNSNTFGSAYFGTTQTSTSGVTYTVTNITSTGFQINILTQSSQSLDKIDGLSLNFTGAAPVSTTPGNVTITATLAPPASGAAPYVVSSTIANKPLLYASRLLPTTVTPPIGATTFATTTLYATFNVSNSGMNLETGIAVANPTGILKSAGVPFFTVGQAGTIKVYFVPSDGSTVQSFTTSATIKPGIGLDANGFLPAGATWNVLLGDMIKLLGTPLTTFQGQLVFVTNFSNAHGINYIADSHFAVQAQGYEMLVVESPVGTTGLLH
jgi:hypothetical protein